MRGKPWSAEEERHLRELVAEGKGLDEIAQAMHRSRIAVRAKLFNLGLSLSSGSLERSAIAQSGAVASALKLPSQLPTIEEKLKVLDAALVALEQPGLSHAEVLRLRTIIQGITAYQKLFADFVNYKGLEAEIMELRKQLAKDKAANASQAAPDPASR